MERSLSEELLTSAHGTRPAGVWEDIEVEPAAPGQSGHVALLRRFAQAVRAGSEADLVATGEDGRRALELANAMLLSGYRDLAVDIPLDRSAYGALLEELKQKAATGQLKKRQAGAGQEQVLATLPEGT
jgi:hypothetical protein